MPRPSPVIPRRASGVLLPVFSLPTALDRGDFGPGAIVFLDWLRAAKQQYWLTLPLGPTDSTGSPYASPSAYALDPMSVSPEQLVERGWLKLVDLRPLKRPLSRRAADQIRWQLLKMAYLVWQKEMTAVEQRRFKAYCAHHSVWLNSYALFAAQKVRHGHRPWWRWPRAERSPRTADVELDQRLQRRIAFEKFVQWVADEQWQSVRQAAKRRGIKIIGDMPYTVRQDSAIVWAHPELFHCHDGRLDVVGGMPPDNFSAAGQRWGTPVHNWRAHRREHYRWWTERIEIALERTDLIRLDHFQGFIREWTIPANHQTALRGHWEPADGERFFPLLKKRLGRLPFIAEDLGLKLPAADRLRTRLGLPGIRLYPFAWNGWSGNIHALHHVKPDVVFMTSNHDLPSVRDWWENHAKGYERRHLRPRLHGQPVWRVAVNHVLQSPSQLAIVTPQDVLGLGREARINRPGTRRGNWRWHLRPTQLTPASAAWLRRQTLAARR